MSVDPQKMRTAFAIAHMRDELGTMTVHGRTRGCVETLTHASAFDIEMADFFESAAIGPEFDDRDDFED